MRVIKKRPGEPAEEIRTEFTAHFSNGDSISGCMNTTPEAVRKIFSAGNFRNIGFGTQDNIQQVTSVEIHSCKEKALTEVATSIVSTQSNNQVQDTPEADGCQDSVLDLLNEMIRLRKEFRRIYSNSGLVSVESSNGIHLNEHYFLQTFTEYQAMHRNGECPYRLVAEYGGVEFFCLVEHLPEREVARVV